MEADVSVVVLETLHRVRSGEPVYEEILDAPA